MTTVYIDTSVAINEAFLRSPYSEAFLKACSILHYTVVIPEIVIDELKGNYPKKLMEKADAFQKAKKELIKLTDLEVPTVSRSDAVAAYEAWLEKTMNEHGVVVVPYPDISAKELVGQSYDAKKPFKETGEGHKDYVVWKTILDHIGSHQSTPPNIFLTNNTKDFCDLDKDGKPILHCDLSQQIDDPVHRPRVYTSIREAFETELSPNLEGITLADIPDLGTNGVDSMAEELLLEDLPKRSLYGLEGVPFSNDITISSIGPHSIEAVSLKKVDEEVIIKVLGSVEIDVGGFIDKFAFYHAEHEGHNMYVEDGDWNDHVMLVSCTVTTGFDLTIFYSTQRCDVTGYEISLPQEIEDEWPYK